jgi:hypothetical protein
MYWSPATVSEDRDQENFYALDDVTLRGHMKTTEGSKAGLMLLRNLARKEREKNWGPMYDGLYSVWTYVSVRHLVAVSYQNSVVWNKGMSATVWDLYNVRSISR